MLIEFANPSRESHPWRSCLRIGSAEDNDLVLREHGVAPRHLCLREDARGVWLEVEPGAGRVYVNARPVRERAMVRAGDSLGLGECRLWLVDEVVDEAGRRIGDRPEAVSLRAVAGPYSGRSWSVGEGLRFGPKTKLPLALPGAVADASMTLEWRGAQLWVSAQVPERYGLRVNGRRMREARLGNGDQLGVGAHRWIVDAWGMRMDEPVPATTPVARPRRLPEDEAGPRGEVWWLIVTAAALGLVIAVLFMGLL